jgi:hypothetical protein
MYSKAGASEQFKAPAAEESVDERYMARLAGANEAIRGMSDRKAKREDSQRRDLEEYNANWPGRERMEARERAQRRERYRQLQYDTERTALQEQTSDQGLVEHADQAGIDREIARKDEEDFRTWSADQEFMEEGEEMAERTRDLINRLLRDTDPNRWSRRQPQHSAFDDWLAD